MDLKRLKSLHGLRGCNARENFRFRFEMDLQRRLKPEVLGFEGIIQGNKTGNGSPKEIKSWEVLSRRYVIGSEMDLQRRLKLERS